MPQPAFTTEVRLSVTDNLTAYDFGDAGLADQFNLQSGRLFLLAFRVTQGAGTPADPTVTLGTLGTAWTKLRTDISGQTITGFYALRVTSNITDSVKIDFGAGNQKSGIDAIVVSFGDYWWTGTIADSFILSALSSGNSTTPSAALASPPPANALTMGFAYKDATTGFTRGANFATSLGTAGHSSPSAIGGVEYDNGTPQQTADWTIPAAVQWYAYAVAVKFDEVHHGPAHMTGTQATAATRTKGGKGAVSTSHATASSSTGTGRHPGFAVVSHASSSAATGKKGGKGAAAATAVAGATGTALEDKSGDATVVVLVGLEASAATGEVGQVVPPDLTTPLPPDWQDQEAQVPGIWDPVTSSVWFIGSDYRAYAMTKLGDRIVLLPRVDLFQSSAFSGDVQEPAQPALDLPGRRILAPWRHVLDPETTTWPVEPQVLPQHLMILDLDRVADRPAFLDYRTFAETARTEFTVPLPLWEPGDLVLVAVSLPLGNAAPAVTITAGWAQLFQVHHSTNGFARYAAFWRVMQDGDLAPTVSWGSSSNPVGVVASYRGADQFLPIAAYSWDDGTGTTATRPSMNPKSRNNRVLGLYVNTLAQPWVLGDGEIERAAIPGLLGALASMTLTEEEDLAGLGATHTESATIGASLPWAAFTILLRPGPVVLSKRRRETGQVRHELISPGGVPMSLRLADWEAVETAAGGYMSAKGTLDPSWALRHPRSVLDGAEVHSFHVPTGECIFAGRALDYTERGEFTIEGVGTMADRVLERMLWQNTDIEAWQPQSSDEFGVPADDDKLTVDISPSRVKVQVIEAVALAGGERQGAVFGAFPETVSRVSFTVKAKGATSSWLARCRGGSGPTYDASDWVKFGSDVDLSSYSSPIDVEIEIPEAPELIVLGLERKVSVPTSSAAAFWVRFTNIKVNGRAIDDGYSPSAMLRDLYGLLGLSSGGVAAVPGTALPRDVAGASVAQIASDLALLVDGWWGIFHTGQTAVGAFGAWGSRVWFLPSARGIMPIPQRRYDSVGVPFVESGSSRSGLAVVNAPYSLPVSRQFTPTLPSDVDEPTALAIATALAPYMVSERKAGDGVLTEVLDVAGFRWSAHRVHAGDLIYVPGHDQPFRVGEVRRRQDQVHVVFPDSSAQVAGIVAAAALQAAQS